MEDSSSRNLPKREESVITFSSQHNFCEGYLVCVTHSELEKGEVGAEAGRQNQSKFRSTESQNQNNQVGRDL